jgi:hypothetical protein
MPILWLSGPWFQKFLVASKRTKSAFKSQVPCQTVTFLENGSLGGMKKVELDA